MGLALAAGAEQSSNLRPMRAALAKMVAALRAVVAVAAVASALLGAERPVSLWWLTPALCAVACWSPFYVKHAWRHGLPGWLVGMDLLLTAALCLAMVHLVSAPELPGTASWVSLIASMAVVSAQLGGAPALSVPAGLLVAASIAGGEWLGHSPDGGVLAGITLATQTVVAAGVMVVAMRTERTAVGAFSALQAARDEAELAAVRREDERAQLRFVHNGPLTTLTMALHANPQEPGLVLRQRAAATLRALPQLAADAAPRDEELRLDEQLAQVIVWYQPSLNVVADLQPCSVPPEIADAFTGAVAEALENISRHAGTARAVADLRAGDDAVWVTVTDHGRGFDPAQPSGLRFGLREDLAGRMAAVGGRAEVQSSPGAGTTVSLEWRRAQPARGTR